MRSGAVVCPASLIKAEHGVDMDTGAIVAVTVQDASAGCIGW